MKSLGSLVCGGLALVASLSLVTGPAQSSGSVLYTFLGATDGANPTGLLTADSAGNLYGVTGQGGDPNCATDVENTKGCGVVFEVAPGGSESVLHTFEGVTGSDGAAPIGGVIRDTSGNLYGATAQGGDVELHCSRGCGTVFKLTSAGTPKILYSFKGGLDGQGPSFGLFADSAHNLYGMTLSGGGGGPCGDKDAQGCGTIFKVTAKGRESILHPFTGGSSDGAYPLGTLVEDASGDLYGTTVLGGGNDGCGIYLGEGCGVVFELAANGTFSIVHAFTGENQGVSGGNDGAYPTGALLRDGSGNLYGTTVGGGSTANCGIGAYGCGTIFKIDSSGNESVLYAFKGGKDGGYPTAGVVNDGQGNLYGSTMAGGGTGKCGLNFKVIGCGVIFEFQAAGTESVLMVLKGKKGAGGYPAFGIVRNAAGVIYSATVAGGIAGCNTGAGNFGCGTVVQLTQ